MKLNPFITALLLLAQAIASETVYDSELCSSESTNWDTSHLSSQISWDTGSGDGCVLAAADQSENRNFMWLDPSLCCSTSGGWSNMRVTAVMRASSTPTSKGRGAVVLTARDATGPDASCDHNTPVAGYRFVLDFGNQQTRISNEQLLLSHSSRSSMETS